MSAALSALVTHALTAPARRRRLTGGPSPSGKRVLHLAARAATARRRLAQQTAAVARFDAALRAAAGSVISGEF
jgi:hypothetical protein